MQSSLGRGLQSLIPKKQSKKTGNTTISMAALTKLQKESIFNIEIDKIKPNSRQPRNEISEAGLKELADSIREHGVLQPLIVTKIEKETDRGRAVEYELIAGERRWRASKIAGLPHVPVIIRGTSAKEKLEIALIENIQREDLNSIDLALAFRQLQSDFHLKHREIAKKVSKDRATVTNILRLLRLPKKVQDALITGTITEGHGRAILIAKPTAQLALFQKIVNEKLGVRRAEEEARKLTLPNKARAKGPKNPLFKKMEKNLQDAMKSRVSITQRGEMGHLRIEFASQSELNKIFRYLLKF